MGGLIGAGLTWMSTTKKGREVRDEILDKAAEVYEDLKKKVMASEQYKKMTKSQFVSMVRDTVDKYAAKNGLADNVKTMMVKLVSAQWDRLRKEIAEKK